MIRNLFIGSRLRKKKNKKQFIVVGINGSKETYALMKIYTGGFPYLKNITLVPSTTIADDYHYWNYHTIGRPYKTRGKPSAVGFIQ